jgi:hypothetical protein
MFKKAFLFAFILLISASVFSIRLIDPLSEELSMTGTNFVGTVAPGNTIELIFSKELVDKYESIDLVAPLPAGFSYNVSVERETLKLFIDVPKDASIGSYPFSIMLSGPNRSDKVPLEFNVVDGALDVSPSDISEAVTNVSSPAEYKFIFVNNTDSDAVFTPTVTLPNNWLNSNSFDMKDFSKKIVVPRRGRVQESVFIYPRLEGKKDFTINMAYANTSKDFAFGVDAKPTLKSKFESPIYGVPFYSFSLLPSYFLGGILSFVFN